MRECLFNFSAATVQLGLTVMTNGIVGETLISAFMGS